MNLISFNIRGLGSGHKRVAFKHFLEIVHPSVVLLHETMTSSLVSCNYFLKVKPHWCVCIVEFGLSGGTLVAWNPIEADMKAEYTIACILIEGKLKGFQSMVRILIIEDLFGSISKIKV